MSNGDCRDCKLHNSNANYPDKGDSHCYMFKEWDFPGICMSGYDPIPKPDTAEENLMDNQL